MTTNSSVCHPFSWALARVETLHLKAFREALQELLDSDQTDKSDTNANNDNDNNSNSLGIPQHVAYNDTVTQWAFNVVLTRSWQYPVDDDSDDSQTMRSDLVPLGDMFNHAEPANDTIQFITKYDVQENTTLTLSYGTPTNPHRFLTVFGFVDTAQPEIFL